MTKVSLFTQDNAPALADLIPYLKGGNLNRISTITGLHKLVKRPIIIAVGDETTVLSTGTVKVTVRVPMAFTVDSVRASLTTAGTGAALVTVDINEAGVSILSTKITIDASEKTSETAATAPVISDSSLVDDAEITIDIDIIDTDNVAAGLKVAIIGHET